MAGAAIEGSLEPDRPSGRRQRGEATACLVAVACVLAVAIALFWFAQPLADDFSRAYKGRVQGTLAARMPCGRATGLYEPPRRGASRT